MYSRDELCLRSFECFILVFIKHQNKPLVSAEIVRHSSTYIILYVYCVVKIRETAFVIRHTILLTKKISICEMMKIIYIIK